MPAPIDALVQDWKANPSAAKTIALCDALRGVPDPRMRPLMQQVGDFATQRLAGDAAVLLSVARMYMEAQRYADAQQVLVAAGKIAPRDADVYRLLGEALLRRGDASRAEKVLARAIQLGAHDEDTQLWLEHARVYKPLQAKDGAKAVAADLAKHTAPPVRELLDSMEETTTGVIERKRAGAHADGSTPVLLRSPTNPRYDPNDETMPHMSAGLLDGGDLEDDLQDSPDDTESRSRPSRTRARPRCSTPGGRPPCGERCRVPRPPPPRLPFVRCRRDPRRGRPHPRSRQSRRLRRPRTAASRRPSRLARGRRRAAPRRSRTPVTCSTRSSSPGCTRPSCPARSAGTQPPRAPSARADRCSSPPWSSSWAARSGPTSTTGIVARRTTSRPRPSSRRSSPRSPPARSTRSPTSRRRWGTRCSSSRAASAPRSTGPATARSPVS